MKVATWNTNCFHQNERIEPMLGAIGTTLKPDVLLMQEVSHELRHAWEKGLAEIGLRYFLMGTQCEKRYGTAIASRYPLLVSESDWAKECPFSELLVKATVCASTPFECISVHIHNGCGCGWKKIDMLNFLSAYLSKAPASPRVLGGDFNEPQEILPGREIATWGQKNIDGAYTCSGSRTDKTGRTGENTEWDRGVRGVLDGEQLHGMRNLMQDLPSVEHPSHINKGSRRRYDHILASRHFHVINSCVMDEWISNESPLSDHAPVWITASVTQTGITSK